MGSWVNGYQVTLNPCQSPVLMEIDYVIFFT